MDSMNVVYFVEDRVNSINQRFYLVDKVDYQKNLLFLMINIYTVNRNVITVFIKMISIILMSSKNIFNSRETVSINGIDIEAGKILIVEVRVVSNFYRQIVQVIENISMSMGDSIVVLL